MQADPGAPDRAERGDAIHIRIPIDAAVNGKIHLSCASAWATPAAGEAVGGALDVVSSMASEIGEPIWTRARKSFAGGLNAAAIVSVAVAPGPCYARATRRVDGSWCRE
jgi:hypothetical protein